MDKKFCDICGEEVFEYSIISMVGKNCTTLSSGSVKKIMRDMELCPSCSEKVRAFCQNAN